MDKGPQDTTFICVMCSEVITVPSADRIGSIELVVDYGWVVKSEGAYCFDHRPSFEA